MSNDIILIEDNEFDSEYAIEFLKSIGFSVTLLSDGKIAMDFLQKISNYDKIFIIDLDLPYYTGIEILEKIRTQENTMHMPVVILTSSIGDAEKIESYKLGVNSYLSKPIDPEKFHKTVKDIEFYLKSRNIK